ncbi:MAG: transcription termination factor Rho, partial [Marmoricola sp.]
MTETTDTAAEPQGGAKSGAKSAPKGGLASMLLPELKQVAGGLGIKATGMKKADLVAAIKAAQGGSAPAENEKRDKAPKAEPRAERPDDREAREARDGRDGREDRGDRDAGDGEAEKNQGGGRNQASQGGRSNQNQQNQQNQGGQNQGAQQNRGGQNQDGQNQGAQNQNQQNQNADGEDGGSRRNRRRRGRDRVSQQGGTPQPTQNQSSGGGRSHRNEPDLQILEDDVLAPCAGILDVLDNYAFVRTSGYLPGPDDVYVSLSTVRKYGLRRGDAVTGQVRQPREGDRKEKFNPLVKLDSVNGGDPEAARTRVEFSKLTPLYPSERLRMETTSTNMIGRVIDIAAPIGKGQRGLIVSPAKAGKTMIMQSIATSITTNNPECHLMVVLVDERPEEVTDFQRTVKGEVIASTFDRAPGDHTTVAELAVERAKRLVELGHDVVVLVDGLSRLGRAYNAAAPATGR